MPAASPPVRNSEAAADAEVAQASPYLTNIRNMLTKVCPADRLRVESVHVYNGPSPHSAEPAIVFRLEAGPDLPPLREVHRQLDLMFPKDFPAPDEDCLPEGESDADALARCVARLAAAILTRLIRIESAWGVDGERPGTAWFVNTANLAGVHSLRLALFGIGCAIEGTARQESIGRDLAELEKLAVAVRPSYSATLMIAAARKRDVPYLQIGNSWAVWQYGWGERQQHFWTTSSNADGMVGHRISIDKSLTKYHLLQLGMPTPAWRIVAPGQSPRSAARHVGWPCVVKPMGSGGGKGVTAGITDLAMLDRAFAFARRHAGSGGIMVEAVEPGDDHRLMIAHGRLIAAVRRIPPSITGDGKSSVDALIKALNWERRDAIPNANNLLPVPDDEALAMTLASQNVARETVLPEGQSIRLRTNSNVSTGGSAFGVLDQVHPSVKEMAEQLAAAIGLSSVGLDYITTDISRSHGEVGGSFIESNTTVGIDVLMVGGMEADTLCGLLLGDRPGRIPITLLLAAPDVQDAIAAKIKPRLGRGKALATSHSTQIGSLVLPHRGATPVACTTAALRYPGVSALTILWNLDDLCRFGLPVDKVETVIIMGARPGDDWLGMLERHSQQLFLVDRPAEALKAIAGMIRTPA